MDGRQRGCAEDSCWVFQALWPPPSNYLLRSLVVIFPCEIGSWSWIMAGGGVLENKKKVSKGV